tara:strand:+ start:352 stop:720 length:369 start_codon:yes stop_codon:yes gene_type:complete
MIKPSLKTQKRLALRLSRHNIQASVVAGELLFMEPVKMKLRTGCGVTFVIDTEIPICPFPEFGHFSVPLSGRVSRLAVAQHYNKMWDDAQRPSKEASYKAIEAGEEFADFLNHIRTPRFSVK